MARRSKTPQSDLVAKTVAPETVVVESTELPRTLGYKPLGSDDQWQAERFDLLATEFQFAAPWSKAMIAFHEFCASEPSRSRPWFFVQRLYGIWPLFPPETADPADLRSHTREELCVAHGIEADNLKEEIDLLRGLWTGQLSSPLAEMEQPVTEVEAASAGELAIDDQLLERFGFSEEIFDLEFEVVEQERVEIKDTEDKVVDVKMVDKTVIKKRSPDDRARERNWFLERLKSVEWQKFLSEILASTTAQEALLNDMQLRRIRLQMAQLPQGSPKAIELSKIKKEIGEAYESQMRALRLMFPDTQVAGKVTFRGTVSDLNLAHRQFYGRGDRRLWDKIHTANEITFLQRQSIQSPAPRYRWGWNMAVIEAIHGLYNPDFRSQLKRSDLAKLDRGFKRGVEEARKELGERMVDLEKGVMPGEGDDFADFQEEKITV